jgi:hypothetical protein
MINVHRKTKSLGARPRDPEYAPSSSQSDQPQFKVIICVTKQ